MNVRSTASRDSRQQHAQTHFLAIVTATPGGGVVTIALDGYTTTIDAAYLDSYTPNVSDSVVVIQTGDPSDGGTFVVVGALA